MPKFWPNTKKNKMTQDYDNNGYTVDIDYHDFIIKEYFSFPTFETFNYKNFDLDKVDDEDELINGNLIYKYKKNEMKFYLVKKDNIYESFDEYLDDSKIKQYLKDNKNAYIRQVDNFELPKNVPSILYSTEDSKNPIYGRIDIYIDKYTSYPKDFNWMNVNWFLSDYNGLNDKIDKSFWHVVNAVPEFAYNKKTGEYVLGKVSYYIKWDAWSNLYYSTMYTDGVLNIKRMHNNRYREDDLYNTGKITYDFIENEYIRNCDSSCANVNQKTQLEKSQILISDRNYDPKQNLYTNTKDTTWDVVKEETTKNVPFVIYIWTTDGGTNAASTSQWTGINGYINPFRLYAYIPTNISSLTSEYNKVMKHIGSKSGSDQRVQFATIGEWVFKDRDIYTRITVTNGTDIELYRLEDSIQLDDEYFWFVDNQRILSKKMFFNISDLVTEKVNYEYEPHCYVGNHYEINLASYGKIPLTFDMSTLLLNQRDYDAIEFTSKKYDAFKLLKRRGFMSPNGNNLTNFLLTKDTSISNKRDNGIFLMPIAGDYSHAIWTDAYIEFMRTNENQKNAGINAINKNYKNQMNGGWIGAGQGILSGIIGGASSGAAAGGIGGIVGGIVGGIGGLINGAFGMGKTYMDAKNNAEIQRTSLDAYYNDAKNKPSNSSGGSISTTATDIVFSRIDDEYNNFNWKKLWTPTITILELKPYEKQNVASYVNRDGYGQNRWLQVKNLFDIMPRKYWNKLQITNIHEFYKKDNHQDFLFVELMEAFSKPGGTRLHNLEKLSYENIYNYNINNYESWLDNTLGRLQYALGVGSGDINRIPLSNDLIKKHLGTIEEVKERTIRAKIKQINPKVRLGEILIVNIGPKSADVQVRSGSKIYKKGTISVTYNIEDQSYMIEATIEGVLA